MIPACKRRLGKAARIGLKCCWNPVFSTCQRSYSTLRIDGNRFLRLAPPSWRARHDPKDGDAMINDAGKHGVKGEGFVAFLIGLRPPRCRRRRWRGRMRISHRFLTSCLPASLIIRSPLWDVRGPVVRPGRRGRNLWIDYSRLLKSDMR